MTIILIAAISANSGLGKSNGDLLFHIKEDMKNFQDYTEGQLCVFGRKTFESIVHQTGGALKKRTSIVLTSDVNYESKYGEIAYTSIDTIINHHKTMGDKDKKVFICGGSEIYSLFMEFADQIILTHINKHVEESEIFYPMSLQDSYNFVPIEESEEYYTEKYDAYYKFVRYTRARDITEGGVDDGE